MTEYELEEIFIKIQHEIIKISPYIPIALPLNCGAEWLKEMVIPEYTLEEIQELLDFLSRKIC